MCIEPNSLTNNQKKKRRETTLKTEAEKLFGKLLKKLKTAAIFSFASSIVGWDQKTKMPEKAGEGRTEIISTLSSNWHKLFTSRSIGVMLDRLADMQEHLNPGQRFIVLRLKAIHKRETEVSEDLFKKFSKAISAAFLVYKQAKEKSNFLHFQSDLEKIVGLVRQIAEAHGFEKNPYDGLLPDFEPGLTTDELKGIINSLRGKLVPLVKRLTEQPEKPNETLLHGHFPPELQRKLVVRLLKAIGFDFGRGRLDTTLHPFTTSAGPNDVRLTTHFDPGNLASGLFGTLHEGGHGITYQGLDPLLMWIDFEKGHSLSLSESQSRLFENLICRSHAFWEHSYPMLHEIFPYFKKVPLEEFYNAINVVKPSPIRIEADELTYQLHIMFRCEIEEALLNQTIEVKDLPEIWNEKMEQYVGYVPKNNTEGVLQDVHWSFGYFGYFANYMLGNLTSAQLFAAAKRAIPNIDEDIAKGDLAKLLTWLRKNVHRFILVREAPELLQAVTGETLNPKYWINYADQKFSSIYV